jgi:hypothetical protein
VVVTEVLVVGRRVVVTDVVVEVTVETVGTSVVGGGVVDVGGSRSSVTGRAGDRGLRS